MFLFILPSSFETRGILLRQTKEQKGIANHRDLRKAEDDLQRVMDSNVGGTLLAGESLCQQFLPEI